MFQALFWAIQIESLMWQTRFLFSWGLHLCVCVFLGLYPQHMEVLSLGVESELQLPAYATATATQDPSHICDLYHSSRCESLTHWARPGIEPESSWILVGFVTTEPQQELLYLHPTDSVSLENPDQYNTTINGVW